MDDAIEYNYKVVIRPNGNLDIYIDQDQLCWEDISVQGFAEILQEATRKQ